MAPTSTFVYSPLTLLVNEESPFLYIQGTGRHTQSPVLAVAIHLLSLTRADRLSSWIIHQALFLPPLLVSVLGRGMENDFLSVMANPTALQQFMEYGFKFQPSDELCFSKYLVPKTRGDIMKGFPIEDVNLCEHEPRNLPEYFFCPRDLRGKNHRRKTKAGKWKSTSNIKSIMAEGTENEIGVMRTLRFYEGEVRTGWMIYEFDLISEPSQFQKGQYVLCKLESDSEGVKSKKRKRSHRIAPVSRSEVEPSQSMDSDSKNINPSEMAVNSPCDESGLSHHPP
ncbi:hypothetical protein OIU77_010278 [Salix suchowensis]|uniref:NAC domain-containing protein n=1 Tax=Salix suchowensis TaxID=1278906 RepID=A0ABQ9A7T2_9ROSI|nr:hypothetical protein OIU77_010278 [Salix suchowensis]